LELLPLELVPLESRGGPLGARPALVGVWVELEALAEDEDELLAALEPSTEEAAEEELCS